MEVTFDAETWSHFAKFPAPHMGFVDVVGCSDSPDEGPAEHHRPDRWGGWLWLVSGGSNIVEVIVGHQVVLHHSNRRMPELAQDPGVDVKVASADEVMTHLPELACLVVGRRVQPGPIVSSEHFLCAGTYADLTLAPTTTGPMDGRGRVPTVRGRQEPEQGRQAEARRRVRFAISSDR